MGRLHLPPGIYLFSRIRSGKSRMEPDQHVRPRSSIAPTGARGSWGSRSRQDGQRDGERKQEIKTERKKDRKKGRGPSSTRRRNHTATSTNGGCWRGKAPRSPATKKQDLMSTYDKLIPPNLTIQQPQTKLSGWPHCVPTPKSLRDSNFGKFGVHLRPLPHFHPFEETY